MMRANQNILMSIQESAISMEALAEATVDVFTEAATEAAAEADATTEDAPIKKPAPGRLTAKLVK